MPNRNSAARLLVIEDEPDLRDAMCYYLGLEGLPAVGAGTLAEADARLLEFNPDLLILDLGLPDGDGLDWLARRPHLRRCGLIVTTARGAAAQRLDGALAGADVYLVKPVQLDELAAVTVNLLRRLARTPLNDGWTLDVNASQLHSPAGHIVNLTRSESRLLADIARSPGHNASREQLIGSLGRNPEHYDIRRMEIMVRRLRNKVREDTGMVLPLDTVHRFGYEFTAPLSEA